MHEKPGRAVRKAGTGGQAIEYLGEWDYPLNKVQALDLYMSRR
ncbi:MULTISPECIES: hypothetical protein [Streptomyces]|nr:MULTISPECIES: hypothetical protein [Streptomyces]MDI5904205.1 hypothetical protein [Streptomyces sp. 12257]